MIEYKEMMNGKNYNYIGDQGAEDKILTSINVCRKFDDMAQKIYIKDLASESICYFGNDHPKNKVKTDILLDAINVGFILNRLDKNIPVYMIEHSRFVFYFQGFYHEIEQKLENLLINQ